MDLGGVPSSSWFRRVSGCRMNCVGLYVLPIGLMLGMVFPVSFRRRDLVVLKAFDLGAPPDCGLHVGADISAPGGAEQVETRLDAMSPTATRGK